MCEKRSLCQRGSTLQGLQQMTYHGQCIVCKRLMIDHSNGEHLECVLKFSKWYDEVRKKMDN